jgi:iron-sulfur cluster repair protein YtfE (RIC family)
MGLTDTSDMANVHQVFRSSLASGPDFVASAAGSEGRRALISNYYLNLIDFLEVHHDGEERLVFPLLAERAVDDQAVVEEAARQHAEVMTLMERVKSSMRDWESTGDAKAPAAVESLRTLDEVLIPHLNDEEVIIVPLASRHLTQQEWGQLPGHAMGQFGGDKIWLIIGLIRENFTEAQRQMMLERMPPPAREMWESMGEAAFTELIAQVRQAG